MRELPIPGGMFGRDQDKLNQGYSLEHTGYFYETMLPAYLEANQIRTDLKEDKKGTAFQFYGMDEQGKESPEGKDCTSVDIQFGAQSSQFTYDTEKMVYAKQINNTPQTDGKTGEQLTFTNVFVLENRVSLSVMKSDKKPGLGRFGKFQGILYLQWRRTGNPLGKITK